MLPGFAPPQIAQISIRSDPAMSLMDTTRNSHHYIKLITIHVFVTNSRNHAARARPARVNERENEREVSYRMAGDSVSF
jgi:hypothetical protein